MSFEHRHTFTYEIYDSDYSTKNSGDFEVPNQSLSVRFQADINLNDILDTIKGYLQGVGYTIDGDIRIVPEEPLIVHSPEPDAPPKAIKEMIQNKLMFQSIRIIKR